MEQRLTCSGAQRDDWEATWAQAVANMGRSAKPVSRLMPGRAGSRAGREGCGGWCEMVRCKLCKLCRVRWPSQMRSCKMQSIWQNLPL
jgi:hypothetical protein